MYQPNMQNSWNYPFPNLYANQNPYQQDMIASSSINNHYNSHYRDPASGHEEQHVAPGHVFHHNPTDYEYDYNVRPRHPKSNSESHQHSHVEVVSTTKNLKSKRKSSVITALTLISFLFFINLLQNCLKENMLTLNPTVMVMTARNSRGVNGASQHSREMIEDIFDGKELLLNSESSSEDRTTKLPDEILDSISNRKSSKEKNITSIKKSN